LDGDGKVEYLFVDRVTGGVQVWWNGAKVSNGWGWIKGNQIASGVSANGWSIDFAAISGTGRADYLDIVQSSSAVKLWANGCPDTDLPAARNAPAPETAPDPTTIPTPRVIPDKPEVLRPDSYHTYQFKYFDDYGFKDRTPAVDSTPVFLYARTGSTFDPCYPESGTVLGISPPKPNPGTAVGASRILKKIAQTRVLTPAVRLFIIASLTELAKSLQHILLVENSLCTLV
jgi:hypothetical protein